MAVRRMDVQMSDKTLKQQREIKAVNGISLAFYRQATLADAIDRLHRKLVKPSQVADNMRGDANE